jgi:trans-aconitate 2-methyltransferase
MTRWNPEQYLKYSGERLRPALDLLSQIPAHIEPEQVIDLGCGPGTVTEILAVRFANARITGLDSSPQMLDEAAKIEGPNWVEGDIATWAPESPVSIIFSNAALHWLPRHDTIFPRLMGCLAPGGVLAVQMPRNQGAPTHTCIAETVMAGSWRGKLEPLLAANAVEEPSFYYDHLAPLSAALSIWETEYLHCLEGENPVVDWTRGTALKAFLDALDDKQERQAFEDDYSSRIAVAYPKQFNGNTLMPFKRLFIVAQALS